MMTRELQQLKLCLSLFIAMNTTVIIPVPVEFSHHWILVQSDENGTQSLRDEMYCTESTTQFNNAQHCSRLY